MTQKEKMLAGQLYSPADPELSRLHRRAVKLARQYNNMTDEEDEQALRRMVQDTGGYCLKWVCPGFAGVGPT